jgi:hypothetical protein
MIFAIMQHGSARKMIDQKLLESCKQHQVKAYSGSFRRCAPFMVTRSRFYSYCTLETCLRQVHRIIEGVTLYSISPKSFAQNYESPNCEDRGRSFVLNACVVTWLCPRFSKAKVGPTRLARQHCILVAVMLSQSSSSDHRHNTTKCEQSQLIPV